MERFLHDVCHGQFLGTARTLNASAIIFLCEGNYFGDWPSRGEYRHQLAPLLRCAFAHFKAWAKQSNLHITVPRFTPSRLNRRLRQSFPVLNTKAVASKAVSHWLAFATSEHAMRNGASNDDRMVAACVHEYTKALRIMDACGLLMGQDQAKQFHDAVIHHLRIYGALHHKSSQVLRGTQPMRCLWQLLPKHHHFFHCAKDTLESCVNPRAYSLLAAESFIGMIGRLCKKCHRSSVSVRALHRYLTCLFFTLRGLL